MMFKKIFVAVLVLIVLGAGATVFYQFTQTAAADQVSGSAAAGSQFVGYGQGGSGSQPGGGAGQSGQNGQSSQGQGQAHQLPAPSELSQTETDALLYMREEEKLARDIYTALYAAWNLPVFQNIAGSEQAHMDAVKALLDVYALEDPVQASAGVFTNPDLQTLYNELIARGSQSPAEALKVGGAIEEIDILDLQARLAQTDNADIQQVFNNLLQGSYNHLGAFARTLQNQTGESYQPQYMDVEAYSAVVSSSARGGSGYGGQGGQGAQGSRGGQGGQGGQRGRGQGGGRP